MLDGLLVIISIIQLTVNDSNSLTVFRAFRLFRAFRALRLVRFMKSLRFMTLIIDVLAAKMTAFAYLFLLLFIFLVMFSLIGEQMYAGKMNPGLGLESFDSFYNSFLSCFQILAIVGWNEIQVLAMNTDVKRGVSIIFLVAVIVIGNYLFLNLFIGVLIGGFIDQLAIKTIEEEEEASENPTALGDNEEADSDEGDEDLGLFGQLQKPLYAGVVCQEPLFLFPKSFWLRKLIYRITTSKVFNSFVFLVIVFSSLKLAIDTYETFSIETSMAIDWALNAIFIVEAVFKVITYGLVMCPNSYLRKGWNLLDLFIILISVIDRAESDNGLFIFKV